MYFTTIITAGLAITGSVVLALPNPANAVGPASDETQPINFLDHDGICRENSGLNLFEGTMGTGYCSDYPVLNDGKCMWFDPAFIFNSAHLRPGVAWSVPCASASIRLLTGPSSALYSSHTCDIESENDTAGSLLQSVDNLFADQPGFTALTFRPRGWQCDYYPPAAARQTSVRSVDTTAGADLRPGNVALCDKARGAGDCGDWTFKNNNCVSIGDDFKIVSIYINDSTTW